MSFNNNNTTNNSTNEIVETADHSSTSSKRHLGENNDSLCDEDGTSSKSARVETHDDLLNDVKKMEEASTETSGTTQGLNYGMELNLYQTRDNTMKHNSKSASVFKRGSGMYQSKFQTKENKMTALLMVKPASEIDCRQLFGDDLINLHDASEAGANAVAKYMGLVDSIDVMSITNQFYEMELEKLAVVLPYTRELRKLVFRVNADKLSEDRTWLRLAPAISKNQHLEELGDIPISMFIIYLHYFPLEQTLLKKLSLDFTSDHKCSAIPVNKFFSEIASRNPNITDLSIGTQKGSNYLELTEKALSSVSGLPLERFSAVRVDFGGVRLAPILTPSLKSISVESCLSMNSGIEEISKKGQQMHEITYIFSGLPPTTQTGSSYAIEIARNNPNLKVFQWIYKNYCYTTCNTEAMEAIANLKSLQKLAFCFYEQDDENKSFEKKFGEIIENCNLSFLSVYMHHINQNYFDTIAVNCKDLVTLRLIMYNDNEKGVYEIKQVMKNLTNLEEFHFSSDKSITEASVHAIMDILPRLQYLDLSLPEVSPHPDHYSILKTGFQEINYWPSEDNYSAQYIKLSPFQMEYYEIFE